MFYENLSTIIGDKYFPKITLNSTIAASVERWNSHLKKLKFETCTDGESWLGYWLDHICDIKPTENDEIYLKGISDSALNDLHLALCTSLKELIANDYETLTSTEYLHQYQLMTKEELKSRGFEVTPQDSFVLDVNKKNKGQLISMEKARSEGICPFCNSKEKVISYGDKWKCTRCKKYFRKA